MEKFPLGLPRINIFGYEKRNKFIGAPSSVLLRKDVVFHYVARKI